MFALYHSLHNFKDCCVLYICFQVLGIEPRSLWMLGKHSATKHMPSLLIFFLFLCLGCLCVCGGEGATHMQQNSYRGSSTTCRSPFSFHGMGPEDGGQVFRIGCSLPSEPCFGSYDIL